MKWPWSKKEPEPDKAECDDQQLEEAREARTTAEHDLRRIRKNRGEVERIADDLRAIRHRNHLAEIFAESIRRKQADG